MLKRIFFLTAVVMSACVTVNIYFPAAAVERAAEQIVKETWGGPSEPAKTPPKPQSSNRFSPLRMVSWGLVSEAHAQEPDINVSNPAIRALKDSIKQRAGTIKTNIEGGKIRIDQDALRATRTTN